LRDRLRELYAEFLQRSYNLTGARKLFVATFAARSTDALSRDNMGWTGVLCARQVDLR
jgi:hypothetical protein